MHFEVPLRLKVPIYMRVKRPKPKFRWSDQQTKRVDNPLCLTLFVCWSFSGPSIDDGSTDQCGTRQRMEGAVATELLVSHHDDSEEACIGVGNTNDRICSRSAAIP